MSCDPCCDQPTTQIPGPQGSPGLNAFTYTTVAFTVPAVNSAVTISVLSSVFANAPGAILFIQGAGYYQVLAAPTVTSLSVKNLGYTGNAAVGAIIASMALVTTAGPIGITGTLNSISPTTTKGDLIVDNGANSPFANDIRLPVGADKLALFADSTQPQGLRYGTIDLTAGLSQLTGPLPIGLGGTGQITQQTALNTLMPSSPILGDLVYFDGTNWVRFPAATAEGMVLKAGTGAAPQAPVWAFRGLIQVQEVIFAGSTGIGAPFFVLNNTIPTTAQGQQVLTLAITPLVATSKIIVDVEIPFYKNGCLAGCAALYINAGTIAVAAVADSPVAVGLGNLRIRYTHTVTSLSPITFTVFAGADAGSMQVNSYASALLWNGVNTSRMTLTEYAN